MSDDNRVAKCFKPPFALTVFNNNGRLNCQIQRGYKVDGEWVNEQMNVFITQLPQLADLCLEAYAALNAIPQAKTSNGTGLPTLEAYGATAVSG